MPTEAEIWQAMHGAIPGPASAPVPTFRGAAVDTAKLQAERDRRAALNRLAQASVPGRVPRPWPYKVSQAPLLPPRPDVCPRCALPCLSCVCPAR